MRKFIWISIFLLFISGCGSRNVQKEKSFVQSTQDIRATEHSSKSVNSTLHIQSASEAKKTKVLQETAAENERNVQNTQTNSLKEKSENNSKSVKKTEYYPNGQKKTEMEMSENYSRISSEKEFYKSRSEQLEQNLRSSIKIQDSIYKQNLKLARNNKELVNINKKSLSILKTTNEKLKKSSERKGITLGNIIWIIGISLVAGAILWEIIKKYLPTKLLSILKIKK